MTILKKIVLLILLPVSVFCQEKTGIANNNSRPKLVVGIVVDQMRWDYLYRYYDRFSNDGFKRLLQDGFSCATESLI